MLVPYFSLSFHMALKEASVTAMRFCLLAYSMSDSRDVLGLSISSEYLQQFMEEWDYRQVSLGMGLD